MGADPRFLAAWRVIKKCWEDEGIQVGPDENVEAAIEARRAVAIHMAIKHAEAQMTAQQRKLPEEGQEDDIRGHKNYIRRAAQSRYADARGM